MILINCCVTSYNKLERGLFIRFLTLRTPLRRPWGFCRWLNSIPSAPQNPYPSYPECTNAILVEILEGKNENLNFKCKFFSLFQLCTQTLSNFPNPARFFLTSRKNMIFKRGIIYQEYIHPWILPVDV